LFDFPVSLTFDGKSVFVTNAAFPGLSPLPIPEPGPSVVQVGVGAPGFPVLGEGLLVGGSTAVPEPTALALAALALVLLVLRRK
jgi:hypothetical protein